MAEEKQEDGVASMDEEFDMQNEVEAENKSPSAIN